ncbi:MAG: undecaprenyldiphospho-muramoylpentapeptide beta-N-acetylglucosaminyltransferase [Chloroflexi bacterium]|nr:undecaprenyldiphospho-muramoylpentapeptide beta-N-acetylglucosaminyltransferase [Chloroflexota bacterium]
MRILFAGGGSGGSTAPLLAVAEAIRNRRQDVEFLYVGSEKGPERALVACAGIPYVGIKTGKLRRYWSVDNFLDLFRLPVGFLQSFRIVRHFRPAAICTAGGFICVPPAVIGSLLRAPVLVHQQDVVPGLANRIISPFARRVTVTFESSRRFFPAGKTKLTGNPVRPEILSGSVDAARSFFGLENNLLTLLVTGGGTGALGLNRLVAAAAPKLVEDCQVIHLSGSGKQVNAAIASSRYKPYEFLVAEMRDALAAADLVVSRAGLSTLTELGALGKPSILIPMPKSHQLANARAFVDSGAAVMLDELATTPEALTSIVQVLLANDERRSDMSMRARQMVKIDAAERIAEEVLEMAGLEDGGPDV